MSHPPAALLAAALIHNKINLEDGYHEIDQDKDGRISQDDLIKSCEMLQLGCDQEAVKELHAKMDMQGTGFVDMSGWKAVLEEPEGIDAVLDSLGITDRGGSQNERDEVAADANRLESAPSLNPPAVPQQDVTVNDSGSASEVQQAVNYLAATLQYNNLNNEEGFVELDADQDGKISLEDLRSGIAALSLPVADSTVEALHKSMDEKGDGLVEQDAWVRMLARAQTEDVLRSRGILPGSEGTSKGLSTGATSAMETGGQNVGDTIAALLQFNELSLEVGFEEFDADGDGAVSVEDVCESAKRHTLEVSQQELRKWHGEHCTAADGKMGVGEWVKALEGANTARVLMSRGVLLKDANAVAPAAAEPTAAEGAEQAAAGPRVFVDERDEEDEEGGEAWLGNDALDGKLFSPRAGQSPSGEEAEADAGEAELVNLMARGNTEDLLGGQNMAGLKDTLMGGASTDEVAPLGDEALRDQLRSPRGGSQAGGGEKSWFEAANDTIAALLLYSQLDSAQGFAEFDMDEDGVVSLGELQTKAEELNVELDAAQLEAWHSELAKRGGGKVDLEAWEGALRTANAQAVLESRGIKIGSDGALVEGSGGFRTDDGPPTDASLYSKMSPQEVSDTIDALLKYNNLDRELGFSHFDFDQDEKISLADLLATSKSLRLEVSESDLTSWHALTNDAGDGLISVGEWCKALENAHAETIFKSRGVPTRPDGAPDKPLLDLSSDAPAPAAHLIGMGEEVSDSALLSNDALDGRLLSPRAGQTAGAGPEEAAKEAEPFNLLERGNTKDLIGKDGSKQDLKDKLVGGEASDSPLIGDEALRDKLRSPRGAGEAEAGAEKGAEPINLLERGNTEMLRGESSGGVKDKLIGVEVSASPLIGDEALRDKLRSPRNGPTAQEEDEEEEGEGDAVPDLMADAPPPPAHLLGMGGDDVSESPLLGSDALTGKLFSPRAAAMSDKDAKQPEEFNLLERGNTKDLLKDNSATNLKDKLVGGTASDSSLITDEALRDDLRSHKSKQPADAKQVEQQTLDRLKLVTITLDADFDSWTDEDSAKTVTMLSEVSAVPSDCIRILQLSRGSAILDVAFLADDWSDASKRIAADVANPEGRLAQAGMIKCSGGSGGEIGGGAGMVVPGREDQADAIAAVRSAYDAKLVEMAQQVQEAEEEVEETKRDLAWELKRAKEVAAEYVLMLETEKLAAAEELEAMEEDKANLVWELKEARQAAIDYTEQLSAEVARLQLELDIAKRQGAADGAQPPVGAGAEPVVEGAGVGRAEVEKLEEELRGVKSKLKAEASQVFFLRTDVERLSEELDSANAQLKALQSQPQQQPQSSSNRKLAPVDAAPDNKSTSSRGSESSPSGSRKALPPPPDGSERMSSTRKMKSNEGELQAKDARIRVLEQELQDLRVTVDTMKQAAELQKEAAEDKLAAVKREASAGLQRSTSPGGAEEEEKIARKPLDAPPSENFHTPLGRTPSAMGLKKSLSDPVLSKKTAELEKQIVELTAKLTKAKEETGQLFTLQVDLENANTQLTNAKATIVKLKAELNLTKCEVESSRESLSKLVNSGDDMEAEDDVDPGARAKLLAKKQTLAPPPKENFSTPNNNLGGNKRLTPAPADVEAPKRRPIPAPQGKNNLDVLGRSVSSGTHKPAKQYSAEAVAGSAEIPRISSANSDGLIRYEMDKRAAAEAESAAEKKTRKTLEDKVVALEKQLEDTRNQGQLVEMALQLAQQEAQERLATINKLQTQMEQTSSSGGASEDEVRALQERVEELEDEVKDVKELHRAQEAALQYVEILEEEKEQAEELRSELQWEVESMRKASAVYCEMLMAENTKLREDLDHAMMELNAFKEKDQSFRFELLSDEEGEPEDKDEQIAKLQSKLQSAKDELLETREELGWELHHAQLIADEYVEVLEEEKRETDDLRQELVWEVNEIRNAATAYTDMLNEELEATKAELERYKQNPAAPAPADAPAPAPAPAPTPAAPASAELQTQVLTLTEQLRTVAVQQDSLRVQLSDALQGRVTSAPDAAAQPSAAEQRMQDMWAEMDKSWQAINQMLRQHTPGAVGSALPAREEMPTAQQAVAAELEKARAERERAEQELEAMLQQHRSSRLGSQVRFEPDGLGSQGLVVWHNGRERGSSMDQGAQRLYASVQEHLNMVGAALVYNQLSVQQGFSAFDADRDGRISAEDMRKSLAELEMGLTEAEMQVLHAELDRDKDGFLSVSEWEEGLRAADYSAVLLSVGHRPEGAPGPSRGESAMEVVKQKLREAEGRVQKAEARAEEAEKDAKELEGRVRELEARAVGASSGAEEKLKEQKQGMVERAEKAEERVRALQGELDALKLKPPPEPVKAGPSDEEIAAMIEEMATQRSEVLEKQHEERLREAMAEVEAVKKEMEEQLAAQHRNAANGGAEVEEMRKALREEEADSARLKKELDSALADLETAQEELKQARAELQAAAANVGAATDSASEEELAKVKAELKGALEGVEKAQTEAKTTREKLLAAEDKTSDAERQLERSKRDCQSLREQLDEAQTIAARLRRGSVEGEEELETARRRVRELEAERNAALDKAQDAGQSSEAVAKLEAALKEKEAELEKKGEELQEKEAEVERFKDNYRDLSAKIEAVEEKLMGKEAEVKTEAEKVERLQSELQVERTKSSMAEATAGSAAELAETQRERDEAKREGEEAKRQRDEAKREGEEAKSERDAAKGEGEQAKSERDAARREGEEAKSERDEAKREGEQAKSKVKELEERAARAEEEKAELAAQREAAVKELEGKKDEVQRQTQTLQEELGRARKLQGEFEKLAEERKTELARLKKELSQAEKSADERRAEADRARRELNLANSRPSTPELGSRAEEELARLRVQLVSLEGERDRAVDAVRVLKEEKAKLAGQRRRASRSEEEEQSEELRSLQGRVAMLQEEAISARALAKAHAEAKEAAEREAAQVKLALQSRDAPTLARELQGRLEALREDVEEARADRAQAEAEAAELRVKLQQAQPRAVSPSVVSAGAGAATERELAELRAKVKAGEEERARLMQAQAAKAELEQRLEVLKGEVVALNSERETRLAHAASEARELRREATEAQEKGRQAEFEHGVLRKVKDALEEKVAALAGEVAEARVRTASLQKQLQAHAAHSHEAPAYANTHHDAAQPAEALAEEVSELQAQLRLETQRKLLAEGKSKLLELELEAVRVQLEEAFERRLADHQKKDGEPSVVEGLKESLKSAHERYEKADVARQDLQRQLDVLSQALPPGDEPLGQEGYPEAASLQQRVKQLLRENAECHAQIRLLGSEVVGLSEALDVVTKRAQNNDVRHQHFQAKVEKFTRNLGGSGLSSKSPGVAGSKLKKKRVAHRELSNLNPALQHSPYLDAQPFAEPRSFAPSNRDLIVTKAYPYSADRGVARQAQGSREHTPQRRRPQSARGRVEEVQGNGYREELPNVQAGGREAWADGPPARMPLLRAGSSGGGGPGASNGHGQAALGDVRYGNAFPGAGRAPYTP